MISCKVCGKGPQDGVSLFRTNPTGVKGIWACRAHYDNPDEDIVGMVNDLEAARDMGLSARNAGEILGAKVVG